MALLRSIAVSLSAIFAAFSFLVLLVLVYEYWWKKTKRSWGFSPKKLRNADNKEDSELVGSSSSWPWEGEDVWRKLFPEGLLRPRFLFTIEEETKEDIVKEDDEVCISFHKSSATCSSETVSISVPPPAHISYAISVFRNKKKMGSEDSCCCYSSACCCGKQGDKEEGEGSVNTGVAGSPNVSVVSSCSSEENSGDRSAGAPFRETVCDQYGNILQSLPREGPFFPRHFSWSGSDTGVLPLSTVRLSL